MNQPSNNRNLIIGIVVVTLLIFGGLVWLILSTGNGSANQKLVFNDANAPALGPQNAPVTVRIFSDFQCPACRLAEPALKATIDKYKDRVRFLWDDFPLEPIHANARLAANAARCAENQGWFWQYHDRLYETQDDWSGEKDARLKFMALAGEFKMDLTVFSECLNRGAEDAKVAEGIAQAQQNRVDQTPTFFINHRRSFIMTPAEWSAALDAALASSSSTKT